MPPAGRDQLRDTTCMESFFGALKTGLVTVSDSKQTGGKTKNVCIPGSAL